VFVGVVHQHKYKKIEIDKFWIDEYSAWRPMVAGFGIYSVKCAVEVEYQGIKKDPRFKNEGLF